MASGNALREVFARFGVDFDTSAVTAGNSAVGGLESALRGLGTVIQGAAIVRGIQFFTSDIAAMGDALGHTATALGLSTQELQEWRMAAAGAGVSAEQLTPAINALRRNAEAASHGAGPAVRDFYRLGISLRDSSGNLRSTNDLLAATVEGLSGIDDPTRRAGMAMRLLGEGGARLGPLLEGGAEGVAAAREELERLGGGLSDETIDATHDFAAETLALDTAITGLRGRIALFFLPIMSALNRAMATITGAFSRLADHSRLLEASIAVLGTAMVASGGSAALAWIAAALPFIVLGLLVAGLILVIDDLWTGLAGGQSVLLDLGLAFEAWSDSVVDGPLRAVADAIDLIFGGIRSATATVLDAAGDLTGDRSLNRDAEGLRSEGVGAALDAIGARSRATPAAALSGASPALDSVVSGLGSGSRGPAGPVSIDRSVRIDRIDTSGLTPAAAEQMITRAIDRASASDSDALADDLTLGGVG